MVIYKNIPQLSSEIKKKKTTWERNKMLNYVQLTSQK